MTRRILFVINHFGFSNGVASVLRSLIANLNKERYEISLLVIYDFNEEFARPIIEQMKVIRGFGFYVRGFDKIVNLIPSGLLYKLFVKNHYDLEIAFQYGIPTKMISASPNTHKICWMHGFDESMVLRKYYQQFPVIVNVSKTGKNKMIKEGFLPEKCEYCYNIIDEETILEKVDESIEIKRKHTLVFITVARLAPDKAFMRYLACIKKVIDELKGKADAEFWIIGDGTERFKMYKYIHINDLSKQVKLLGEKTNPYKYIKNADCYFCGSYHEGFSTTCQEAAIIGIPVVCVNVNGANELNEMQGAGRVIENNEDAIYRELISIIQTPQIVFKWKSIAFSNRNKFYKQHRIKKIEEVLDKY